MKDSNIIVNFVTLATTKNMFKVNVKSIHEGFKYNCELCDFKATSKIRLNNM